MPRLRMPHNLDTRGIHGLEQHIVSLKLWRDAHGGNPVVSDDTRETVKQWVREALGIPSCEPFFFGYEADWWGVLRDGVLEIRVPYDTAAKDGSWPHITLLWDLREGRHQMIRVSMYGQMIRYPGADIAYFLQLLDEERAARKSQ